MIHSIGPGVTVQDLGRPGWTAQGLSTGGAADRRAILEAAAILDTPIQAGLEMMGFGGVFSVDRDTRIALTGAQMQASIDGAPVPQNTAVLLRARQKLTIGGAKQGVYGYLSFAGGIATPQIMGSRAAHLTAAIGGLLQAGATLPLGKDTTPLAPPVRLTPDDRCAGGTVRVMPGPQTGYFDAQTPARFTKTQFTRSPRGNRQGVRLDYDGDGFTLSGGLNITSDLIVPGDIQMTGDGVPYVLLAECQTIGGYPRIGTVLPADLPIVAQSAPGTKLRFVFVTVQEADTTATSDKATLAALRAQVTPIIRDPHDIADLLSYQLISGVTAGNEL
ncbi:MULTISPECIES: biotin-dependent carboxyltransferase family protein [Rhodobacterales]|uniref:5-oxoprolinase subunit C family protein n=1 Tax=Rhodobacterales TaxID=204455 RepID=UPI00215D847B|nr:MULTISPECIES: biotin-dependent carboxyltransferase family protein [Rhodobacterales]MDO6592089.1 biotin-dependent carboxyltransferase family protein [Yoonia sp. 1_MG-2023]